MDEVAIKDIDSITYSEGKIYMLSSCIPIVMVYDFDKKRVEKLCNYPRGVNERKAFEKMVKYGTKLYLFPCYTDSIYYYDLELQRYTKLVSLHLIEKIFPNRKFFEIVVYGELIYAVCRFPNLVISINPKDDSIQIWELDQKIQISDKIILADFSVCVSENSLLYPYSTDMVIKFNIDDKNYEVTHLIRENEFYGEKYKCLMGMTMNDTGKQWVYDWYGSVYEIVNNKMVKITMPPELEGVYNDGVYTEETRISGILSNKDQLYFVLNSDKRILVYDIDTNSFTWIDNIVRSWKALRRSETYITHTYVHGNIFLLYDYNDGTIHVLDLKDGFGEIIELYMLIEDITKDNFLWEYWKGIIFSQEDLASYMKYLWKISDTEIKRDNNCFGERIHTALIK